MSGNSVTLSSGSSVEKCAAHPAKGMALKEMNSGVTGDFVMLLKTGKSVNYVTIFRNFVTLF